MQLLLRVGDGISQDQTSLGVGVFYDHILAVVSTDDGTWLHGFGVDEVFAARDRHRERSAIATLDQGHKQLNHQASAAHVIFHAVDEAFVRLQIDPAGIEGNTLADEQKGL